MTSILPELNAPVKLLYSIRLLLWRRFGRRRDEQDKASTLHNAKLDPDLYHLIWISGADGRGEDARTTRHTVAYRSNVARWVNDE